MKYISCLMFLILMMFGNTSQACTMSLVGSKKVDWGVIYTGSQTLYQQTQLKIKCDVGVEYVVRNEKEIYGDFEKRSAYINQELTVNLYSGLYGVGTGEVQIYTIYHKWAGSENGMFIRGISLSGSVNYKITYGSTSTIVNEQHALRVNGGCLWEFSSINVNIGEIKFGEKGYISISPQLYCGGNPANAKIYPITDEYVHNGVEDIVFRYIDTRNNLQVTSTTPYVPTKTTAGKLSVELAIEASGVNSSNGNVLTKPQSFNFSYPLIVEF